MGAFRDAVWRDGALLFRDGTVCEHAFESAALADAVRRTIVCPSDAGPDTVFASELSVFTSGRYHRHSVGFSIYWHSHSDIIFALTGITHCVRVYVECGEHRGERQYVFPVPNVYVMHASDRAGRAERVTWPVTGVTWLDGVAVAPRMRQNPSLRILNIYVDDFASSSGVAAELGLVSTDVKRLRRDELHVRETPIFTEKVSIAYRRLGSSTLSLTARLLLDQCACLAASKRMRLVEDTPVGNFFLCHVALYVLGEDNYAEEMIGVLFSRTVPSDDAFAKHVDVLNNASSLAAALNCLRANQASLATAPGVSGFRRGTGEGEDGIAAVADDYYGRFLDVDSITLRAGRRLLTRFAECWSVERSFSDLGVDGLDFTDTEFSVGDVLCLLRS